MNASDAREQDTIARLRLTIDDLSLRLDRISTNVRDVPYAASNANLYLALPKESSPTRWWVRILARLSIASWFKLKPFGEPHDPMARNALYFSQWLLFSIFLLEWVGWSLLFNDVLNGGVLQLSVATVFAVAFALLFAVGTLALEQAILTADVSDGWQGKRKTLVFRILIILFSALITTQPYELAFFRSEVASRIHQESVRAEMAVRYEDYRRFGAALTAGADTGATGAVDSTASTEVAANWFDDVSRRCPEPQAVTAPSLTRLSDELADHFDARQTEAARRFYGGHSVDCDAALSTVPKRLNDNNARLSSNSEALVRTRREISSERAACDQSDPESECVNRLVNLASLERQLLRQRGSLDDERVRIQRTQDHLTMNMDAFARRSDAAPRSTVTNRPEDAGASATPEVIRVRTQQLKNYLTRLAHSNPGDTIQLEPYRNIPEPAFRDRQYGITDKIRVLYSELRGVAYQWPSTDAATKNTIASEFALSDPEPGWRLYRFVPWLAVLFAAMFLPFVSLVYKLTLNENLNLYYVTEYQELLGHVGAMITTDAKRRFWEQRRHEPPPVVAPPETDSFRPSSRTVFAARRYTGQTVTPRYATAGVAGYGSTLVADPTDDDALSGSGGTDNPNV